MAFLEFNNVRIAGISAGVPRKVRNNLDLQAGKIFKDYTAADFVETTGVVECHFDSTLTTSDLCLPAAEKLIADLGWNKQDIDGLIFVSQTADYVLPATACILQNKLGLSSECYAEDISLGCSGWVYGLSNAAALISNGGLRKVLMLVGDARHRMVGGAPDPLFGYAGTVTALEYYECAESLKFHFGTDGSGFDFIITPDGGSRNQISLHSFDKEDVDGKLLSRLQCRMKGLDVFAFGISTAPKSVRQLATHFGIDYQSHDYFIFHQANMKMNNMIVKKLKLDQSKVPSCMSHYGNTSSASIPLTIVTQLKGKTEPKLRFLCCGFGVGLSWGTVSFTTQNLLISDVVEVDSNEG